MPGRLDRIWILKDKKREGEGEGEEEGEDWAGSAAKLLP
jgi:hypothetical protein